MGPRVALVSVFSNISPATWIRTGLLHTGKFKLFLLLLVDFSICLIYNKKILFFGIFCLIFHPYAKKFTPWAYQIFSQITLIAQHPIRLGMQLGLTMPIVPDGVTYLFLVLSPDPQVTSGKYNFGVSFRVVGRV